MKNTWNVYRIVRCDEEFNSGLIVEISRQKAIEVYCRLHLVEPTELAVLYSYPFYLL